jgi:hypothetical protein
VGSAVGTAVGATVLVAVDVGAAAGTEVAVAALVAVAAGGGVAETVGTEVGAGVGEQPVRTNVKASTQVKRILDRLFMFFDSS